MSICDLVCSKLNAPTLGIAILSTPFTTHASQPDASRDIGVESGRFHTQGDQTFTVLERWAFLTKSGGLFRDMMIHDFDMARWMLGEEPTSIHSSGSCLVDPEIGKLGDIDTACVSLVTANGKQVVILNSRRTAYGFDQRIEAFGSAGMVISDNPKATA
jgi:predicted dehydrogenase